MPNRSFQEIAVDFCSHAGHEFLIMVDSYTDWPDVVIMDYTPIDHSVETGIL